MHGGYGSGSGGYGSGSGSGSPSTSYRPYPMTPGSSGPGNFQQNRNRFNRQAPASPGLSHHSDSFSSPREGRAAELPTASVNDLLGDYPSPTPVPALRAAPHSTSSSSSSSSSFFARRSHDPAPPRSTGAASSDTSGDMVHWVTVFGFDPEHFTAVLTHLYGYGDVERHVLAPGRGNFAHVQFRTKVQAQNSLQCNGKMLGNFMIGVVPCTDRRGVERGKAEQGEKEHAVYVSSPSQPLPSKYQSSYEKFLDFVFRW